MLSRTDQCIAPLPQFSKAPLRRHEGRHHMGALGVGLGCVEKRGINASQSPSSSILLVYRWHDCMPPTEFLLLEKSTHFNNEFSLKSINRRVLEQAARSNEVPWHGARGKTSFIQTVYFPWRLYTSRVLCLFPQNLL